MYTLASVVDGVSVNAEPFLKTTGLKRVARWFGSLMFTSPFVSAET